MLPHILAHTFKSVLSKYIMFIILSLSYMRKLRFRDSIHWISYQNARVKECFNKSVLMIYEDCTKSLAQAVAPAHTCCRSQPPSCCLSDSTSTFTQSPGFSWNVGGLWLHNLLHVGHEKPVAQGLCVNSPQTF